MKSCVYILFIALIASSCVTQKRCMVKFPPDTTTHVEQVRDTVYEPIFFDLHVPGDTSFVEAAWSDDAIWGSKPTTELVDAPISYTMEPILAEVPLAYSKAWIEGNMLKMLLIQKDSVFQLKLDSAKQIIRDSITVNQMQIISVEVVPKWATTYRSLFWFEFALIIIILALLFLFLKMK